MLTVAVVSFVAGGVVVGVVANRKPEWFANVVKVVNAVDAKVNAVAAQAKAPPKS